MESRYAGIQWRVIIPQALRVALPALANEYIAIVKLSSAGRATRSAWGMITRHWIPA
jgi:ABC-type amino acid transport system permease subunit